MVYRLLVALVLVTGLYAPVVGAITNALKTSNTPVTTTIPETLDILRIEKRTIPGPSFFDDYKRIFNPTVVLKKQGLTFEDPTSPDVLEKRTVFDG